MVMLLLLLVLIFFHLGSDVVVVVHVLAPAAAKLNLLGKTIGFFFVPYGLSFHHSQNQSSLVGFGIRPNCIYGVVVNVLMDPIRIAAAAKKEMYVKRSPFQKNTKW